MRPKPYIGVTGVTNESHSRALVKMIPQGSKRVAMLGLLVSQKTLRGLPNNWHARYPGLHQLSSIFIQDWRALNLIHFNTKDEGELFNDMQLAQSYAGEHCDGFQLNMAWPSMHVLQRYKSSSKSPRRTVVMQCGKEALSSVDYSGYRLAKKVRLYVREGLIDYVLIDPSCGEGKVFDKALAIECFRHLQEFEELGLGIAGGLHPSNIDELLRPIVEEFPELDFSIDAEGKLRNVEDQLDLPTASAYLQKGQQFF